MGNVDDANVLLLELLDYLEEALYLIKSKCGSWLVQNKNLGVTHKTAENLNHALLSNRKCHCLAVQVKLPANLFHGVFEHLVKLGLWSLKTNGDVLSNGHVREQHWLLRNHINTVCKRGLRVGDINLLTIDRNFSLIGRVNTHDDLHEGRFTGTVATNKRNNLSWRQI